MSKQYKEIEAKCKPVVVASAVWENSPALDYSFPQITQIATSIESEYPSVVSKGFLEALSMGDYLLKVGDYLEIDCGMKISVPHGYNIYLKIADYLGRLGLFSNLSLIENDDNISIIIFNFGKVDVNIKKLDQVGLVFLVPIFKISKM